MKKGMVAFVFVFSGLLMPVTALARSINLSASSLTFSSTALGTTSAAQTLTVTNISTSSFNVTGVKVTFPFFQTGFIAKTLSPGASESFKVFFFPTSIGTAVGTLMLTYNNGVPSNGVSLSGNGVAAISLGVDTFSPLPGATQGFPYQATLTAAGGAPPYTWSITSGSLPGGLSLASSGIVSGTVGSTVTLRKYQFTAQVTDSKSAISKAVLTIQVYGTTGAACGNIIWEVAGTSSPIVPITDLGTNTYLGVEEGGLYANGSNVRPASHDADGVALAAGIQPLDSNGSPSSSGKYAMISIGLSATQQPFIEFQSLATADPTKNPALVIVNGAQGNATASNMANLNSTYWNTIMTSILPAAGVTANQVVVAWVNDVNGGPSGTFPSNMITLQSDLETIAQNLFITFPNIKLAYYSSFTYAGYSNGVTTTQPEPFAYESGFAAKNAIQDQLNGNANLNYKAANGPVMAPWMAWGPYYWANGMLPRSDGLVWSCQDFKSDGTHASNPVGRVKVSTQLLNFFKTDDTTMPWFLAH